MKETFMTRVLLLALIAGAGAAPAFAQAPAGPCKPVFDAMLKEAVTPHHAVTTTNGKTNELIRTADETFLKIGGTWKRSPMSPQDLLAQQQKNIRDTTSASCTVLPGEVVSGTAATVYHAHYEQPDLGVTDAKVWIGKTTGLPLRTDVSLQAGQKVSVVSTFDYDHITAPPVD
jgi:hypothetical protein